MASGTLRSFHVNRPLQFPLPHLRRVVQEVKELKFISAVKTPYLTDGRIDLEAYDVLVKTQVENGAEGILVGGSTGEGQLMSWNDHVMLVAHTVHRYGSKTKVIGNLGSNCTSEAITATEQGFAVGMHAALHINPFYCRTSVEGLLSHFNSLLPIGPLIVYNIPVRSGQDVPPEVIHALSKHPNFVGVKECTGKMDRVEEYVNAGIAVWTGMDAESHAACWKHGATGVQSVASNLVPGLIRELMYGGWNPELNEMLVPLYNWLSSVPNPMPVSTALAQLGLIKPVFKLPYVPVLLEKRKEFVNLVNQIGRDHFVGDKDVQVLDDEDFVVLDRY